MLYLRSGGSSVPAPSRRAARKRMQPPRLSIKSLWRLYQTAQTLLKSGQTADAAVYDQRMAAARVRAPRGGERIPPEDRIPLANRDRLGLCYCYVEQGQ